MLHKEEVIGPAITDEFLYGLSQFLLARDGKNKGRQKFNTGRLHSVLQIALRPFIDILISHGQ
jgi:hypothetical protein